MEATWRISHDIVLLQTETKQKRILDSSTAVVVPLYVTSVYIHELDIKLFRISCFVFLISGLLLGLKMRGKEGNEKASKKALSCIA